MSALLAQLSGAASHQAQLTFELGRVVGFTLWQWLLLIAVCVGVVAWVVFLYLRDTVELGRGVAGVLILLRLGAWAGVLWIFLLPQYRVERQQEIPSRVLLLVDTSQSMAQRDEASPDGSPWRRIDAAVHLLERTPLLKKLRQVHHITVLKYSTKVEPVAELPKLPPGSPKEAHTASSTSVPENVPKDWASKFTLSGQQSRLGEALHEVLTAYHQEPVAGVVILSDGQNNAGPGPEAAVALARENRVGLYPVGLGSAEQERRLQVAEFLVPPRAFPGDAYQVTAYLRGWGLQRTPVLAELLLRPAGAAPEAAKVVDSQQLTLPEDGDAVRVQFQQRPEEPGPVILTLRVRTLSGKPSEVQQEKTLEVVDYKTRVLLFAGGPTREYRFLRNQLKRDPTMLVDVLLQTAQEGISQEADRILDDFPATRPELYEYDCLVAFDPDWRQLSESQIELLQDWVAQEAGGLILVAGPIYMDIWVRSQTPAMKRLRNLMPVVFPQHFGLLESEDFRRRDPAPLDFTPEGLTAPFVQLADTPEESHQVWASFAGVYGYYRVRGAKPAATVFCRVEDLSGEEGTVFLAGHFYGSGRVFYLGSGEMWRIRSQGAEYFEAFWTKLIRHVSQGRLLRGSKRGVLLVEQDTYQVGQTVSVRAQLKNPQHEPLQLPQVVLEIVRPDQKLQTLTLTPVEEMPGTYAGQFTVYLEGNYRLQLPVPESDEVLTWSIEATVPDLERQNAQRNDPLLTQLAKQTQGRYLRPWTAAVEGSEPLWELLPDRRRTVILRGTPRTLWDNRWTLLGICGLLFLEWLIRRLSKLA